MLCDYGCGNEARFYSKWNKKHRCSQWPASCPAMKLKNSESQIGKHQVLVGTFTGKTHSEETKQKISNKMKGNRHATHRGDKQSFYKDIRMDSRWEVGVAAYFDAAGVEWKYGERGFKLSDGRYYYPDFFIYEQGNFLKLIEVKGYFREANRLKMDMFLREYPSVIIELWERPKLRELGIIDSSGYIVNGDAAKLESGG